ncbi:MULTISPECIES: hypothetical protein [unclassified Hyphomonas]|uniref:hypothetical protein n=1 Tax=unclassified Hyphomonas TaxID=2630699 RepID=UPI0012DE2765|nr:MULTISPECIES: hypothetical protein [unclassified Hyphomonas]
MTTIMFGLLFVQQARALQLTKRSTLPAADHLFIPEVPRHNNVARLDLKKVSGYG